mmetsp:Transcript_1081/g.1720  ORF Transcript_1081/g.1720 Transcript_1081/m.1720 type:complete len:260 (+) Transcript_1081:292-1071(+)
MRTLSFSSSSSPTTLSFLLLHHAFPARRRVHGLLKRSWGLKILIVTQRLTINHILNLSLGERAASHSLKEGALHNVNEVLRWLGVFLQPLRHVILTLLGREALKADADQRPSFTCASSARVICELLYQLHVHFVHQRLIVLFEHLVQYIACEMLWCRIEATVSHKRLNSFEDSARILFMVLFEISERGVYLVFLKLHHTCFEFLPIKTEKFEARPPLRFAKPREILDFKHARGTLTHESRQLDCHQILSPCVFDLCRCT